MAFSLEQNNELTDAEFAILHYMAEIYIAQCRKGEPRNTALIDNILCKGYQSRSIPFQRAYAEFKDVLQITPAGDGVEDIPIVAKELLTRDTHPSRQLFSSLIASLEGKVIHDKKLRRVMNRKDVSEYARDHAREKYSETLHVQTQRVLEEVCRL